MQAEVIIVNSKKINSKMLRGCSDLMTPKQVQDILQIGRGKMYKLINSNQLKVLRIGREYRIPKVYLLDYLNENA